MAEGMQDHPLRAELTREVHARPFARLQAPERATHLALVSGEAGAAGDRATVAALCARYGVSGPGAQENFLLRDLGPFRLRWERHTEFSTYTFFAHESAAEPSPRRSSSGCRAIGWTRCRESFWSACTSSWKRRLR